MRAQTAHPFAAATSSPLFSMAAAAALADVNRDGSPDVIVPGLFTGTLVSTLDEDGVALANNVFGPNLSVLVGVANLPQSIGMVGGCFDGDDLQDLFIVTNNGTVHFHRNLGATQLAQTNWAPDVIVDDFHVQYPTNAPFITYGIPVVEVLDFDLDGILDVLVAGGPVNRWSGLTMPGFVGLYKGDGAGGFQVMRYGLPGSVVDVEFADLDNDGTRDGLVVLMETGAVGVFSYELVHLTVSASGVTPLGLTQLVGPARLSALEMGDVVGDSNNDYILAQVATGYGNTSAAVYFYQGDGQGNVGTATWGTFTLPANVSGMSDFITSLQVGDFNRDGHTDIAMLRGFVQAAVWPSVSPAIYHNSEVLVAMGPGLTSAAMQSIPLLGGTRYADTPMFAAAPLIAEPEGLRCVDLGGDSCIDFLVTGLRVGAAFNVPAIATIKNMTVPLVGDARHLKVGHATGAVMERPARLGFEGGRPVPGNASYACTIQNVQGGCLVGLMWSPLGSADLFSLHGFSFHIAPQLFGYANIASGGLAANGFYSYPLPIPNNPALVGDVGCFQYCYYDHVTGAFGGTQATCVWVGN